MLLRWCEWTRAFNQVSFHETDKIVFLRSREDIDGRVEKIHEAWDLLTCWGRDKMAAVFADCILQLILFMLFLYFDYFLLFFLHLCYVIHIEY